MRYPDEEVKLSDQEYLVHRARIDSDRDPSAAKVWMLTANSLFPDNFSIQFESYTTERKAGHVKECAKCLEKLLKKFPQEDQLWQEIDQIVSALKNSHKPNRPNQKPEEEFLLKVYGEINESVQQKILIQASERSGAIMQKCRLLLILMKRFPGQISKYGERLIETLLAAEQQELGNTVPPLNNYRKVLFSEVLPTVLTAEKASSLQHLLLNKLLIVSLEFVVAYVNSPTLVPFEVKDPWKTMFVILEGIGSGLNWLICKNISKSKPENIISSLSGIQRQALQSDPESSTFKQFFYCAIVTCLQSVFQYWSLLDGKESEKILVEAFVTHQPDPKMKRRKTTEDAYSPLLSNGNNITQDDPLIMEFQIACGAWQLLCHPTPPPCLTTLLSQLGSSCSSLDCVTKFRIDYQLQAGQFRECLHEIRQYFHPGSEKREQAWSHLKLCVLNYCSGDFRAAAQSAVDCLQHYDSIPAEGKAPDQAAGLTQQTQRPRHLRFIPFTQYSVLSYICKLVGSLLQERTGTAGDLALGHTLVLTQCNWPLMKDLLYLTLHRIQMKQGLSYPLFCDYVVNIEILEELTYLNTPQGGSLPLDISPDVSGSRASRPGTRGANRGEKEDFKIAMKRQALRSHEPVDRLILEFLTKHKDMLLQCLG